MANTKKPSVFRNIVELILLIPTLFGLLERLSAFAQGKARVAGKHLVTVAILSSIALVLLMSTWLCVLGLLFFYLTSLQLNLVMSLFILLGLNIFLLLVVLWIISRNKLLRGNLKAS